MKNKKLFLISIFALFSLKAFSAEEKNPDLYVTIDGAYYPESEYRTSSAHMSKLTGAYYGLEGRATMNADYTIKTPLGEHWLLKDAKIVLNGAFELSPVTIRPKFSVSFTPVPFLQFSAGTSIGTGWTIFGWEGMSILNKEKKEYEDLTPFTHFYYDFWAQGTFQFDTGAIFEGDWTHVLFLASYQAKYAAISGVGDDEIWEWQASDNKANGFQVYVSSVIAYQMPKKLNRVGFLFELEGHYKESDYAVLNNNFYKGDFKTVSVSPFAYIKFNEKNTLTILASVSSRRAFEEEHEETTIEPYLNYIGYEWYFKRIALSFTHTF